MWPVLLNMTRDDCRRTLRRLELEAYSSMVSVFRAQGALEDNRRKLLEDLRDALHIGSERHSAEARRAANDELLATIAEHLSGPNTGLGWINEGRRLVPLMPRGIPQSAYTELADQVALQAAAENEELRRKKEAERLAPQNVDDIEMAEAGEKAAESASEENVNLSDETLYPPVVMEDQSMKILEMEALGSRKRKVTESSAPPDDSVETVEAVKNINRLSNQKHLNLSHIYSNFSKTPSGKSLGQSKHSYNQVSKVSTKSNQTPRSVNKRRKQNPSERTKSNSKSQKFSSENPISSKQYVNPISMQLDFSQPPSSFQASYAQSVLSGNLKSYDDEPKVQQNIKSDSQTMRHLAQPQNTPHELGANTDDSTFTQASTLMQAQNTPVKSSGVVGKACQFVIKKGNLSFDKTPQKVQMSDIKILKKPAEGIKVLPKKQIVVAPNPSQKIVSGPGRVVQSKIVQSTPSKAPAGLNTSGMEKMIVMPGNHQTVQKSIRNPKNIILTSANVTTPVAKGNITIDSNSISPKIADDSTPKGIAANDVKVSAKTFLLNPKSGQKMVVLPAKNKGKQNEGPTMPLIHFKSIPTTMKLVPVSSSVNQISKSNANITIVSRPSMTAAGTPVKTKVVGFDGAKSLDSMNKGSIQGLRIGTKVTSGTPLVRPPPGKGSIIVVQKGTPLGKTLTFSKSGNEMSKIVMGKNVNKLIQAQGEHAADSGKKPGNVIVLDLNDQLGPTTMSKILDSHTAKTNQTEEARKENLQVTTENSPVLFDNQITEETCNANSMDSLSTVDMGHLEDGTISSIDKEEEKSSIEQKENESAKDISSVTDWEMELDTAVGRKRKNDSSSSINLELCMSSDSETDGYLVKTEKPKKQTTEDNVSATDDPSELFAERGGLSLASRTLLSQLQDEGSSSNDSSFTLNKSKLSDKVLSKNLPLVVDKDLSKGNKIETVKQVKRLDIFGAADMQLGAFAYLESDEGMMSGEDMFGDTDSVGVKTTTRSVKDSSSLDLQLSQLLADNASDTNNVSEMPLSK